MIKGDQPVHFSGPTETAPSALPSVSGTSPDNGASTTNGANNSLTPVQPTNSANNSMAPVPPMTTSSIPPSGGRPAVGPSHPWTMGPGPAAGAYPHGATPNLPGPRTPDPTFKYSATE